MKRRRRTLAASAALVTMLAGCGREPSPGTDWMRVASASMSPQQEAQLDLAQGARDALATGLQGELSAALGSGGPASAIGVCSEAAPRIGKAVEGSHGVRIGRTSWKLRNPENKPPDWAKRMLMKRPEAREIVASPTGELGVTFPIRIGSACLACHGAPDSLDAEVRDALASSYPDDSATGFADGDLRGWFWVEVPASSR